MAGAVVAGPVIMVLLGGNHKGNHASVPRVTGSSAAENADMTSPWVVRQHFGEVCCVFVAEERLRVVDVSIPHQRLIFAYSR